MSQFEMFGREECERLPTAAPPAPSAPGPEAARASALRMLGQLLGQLTCADAMPWDAAESALWIKIYCGLADRLDEFGETADWNARLDAELVRLHALPVPNAA